MANCVHNIAVTAHDASASGHNCEVNPKHNIRPHQNGITAAMQQCCDHNTVPLRLSYISFEFSKINKIVEEKEATTTLINLKQGEKKKKEPSRRI